ncbi:MAG: nucleotide sugar dehydrogenase [Gammaproteobacteria bacterium]|nr:nucleotide sugar dehydrogenase [Gammaproteobacteria bacterium]
MEKDVGYHISVIGLGYVGLPVAVAFGKKQRVIAFDINPKRITELQKGYDHTQEVSTEELAETNLLFTHHATDLKQANFHIIAVPTPINLAKQPDLSHLLSASTLVAPHLKKGDIVVYESTVYPGVTEEICAPVLEKESGLKCGVDFFVGYSPERLNPGDSQYSFTNICKVVSGQTPAILDIIADVYGSVVTAGVFKASSIKVAEAAKVIENTQRDLNIALINEISIIFNKLGIDTAEVLEAAGTKWNFLPFKPGLVGGHCIGVDPYYLTHKANMSGVHPEVILAGRRINDNMGKYIAERTVKEINRLGKPVNGARIGVMGLTFKENCSDIRNTKVIDIIQELNSFHANIILHDPRANREMTKKEYDLEIVDWDLFTDLDAIILAVAHDSYRDHPLEDFVRRLNNPKLIIDIKGVLDPIKLREQGVHVWRL